MSTPIGFKREWFATVALNNGTVVDAKESHTATSVLHITKITINITTHADGKLINVKDDDNNILVHFLDADYPGVFPTVPMEFGKYGIPVVAGNTIQVVSEAAGPVGFVYFEGWEDIGDGTW